MATEPASPTANVTTGAKIATHPIYQALSPVWRKLANVREGTGGFLDGTYLIAHPREWKDHDQDTPVIPTKKLLARRALACFENFAATIMESKKAALFREGATRRVGDVNDGTRKQSDIETWWEDVDGRGFHIDDYMPLSWDGAATFGHVLLYMDRPKGPAGTTAADAAQPFLRMYAPLDVLDWLEDDRGALTGVKFQEAVPREQFNESPITTQFRIRVVTTEYWALYDKDNTLIEGGPELGKHEMGTLPVVPLFALRRPLIQSVGQSVLGDPQLYVDIYNLTSEVRELLRNQTFSFINLPLGTGPDAQSVAEAQAMLGQQTGTTNVLFSALSANILSADSSNVDTYHNEIARRLRTIFRLAGVQWESDSKDAEAKGSLQLKREEMNTRLASYGDELERTEYKIADLYYRAKYGKDLGPKKLEADKVVIRYPDVFDVTPFSAVLEQAQAALSLGMPGAFLKELRKSLVSKFLPDLPETLMKQIEDAITNAPDDPTPEQRLQARLTALTGSRTETPHLPIQTNPAAA